MNEPRTITDRYLVLDHLSHGGASEVYKVRDQVTGETLALKHFAHLRGSPGEMRRFKREFQLLSKLSHPNVVEVKETGSDADIPFFTMEYLEGASLADLLKDKSSKFLHRIRSDSTLLDHTSPRILIEHPI
jgi:serine/threonine protein kinase